MWDEEERKEVERNKDEIERIEVVKDLLEKTVKKLNLDSGLYMNLQDLINGKRKFCWDFILFVNEVTRLPYPK